MFDTFFFAAVPYLAVAIAVIGGVVRYRSDRFSYSSYSSQFLENRTLFWGSVTWHYGILLVLAAHVVALVFWDQWAIVLSSPTRLYSLEVAGLALSLLAFAGLAVLTFRRFRYRRVATVTTAMDWVLLVALLGQVATGIWIALEFRWGSSWYVHTVVPWLISLFKLDPRVELMTILPWVVKVHAVGGFVLIALFPFTRLVHAVAYPVTYVWRPFQVVIWNRHPAHRRTRAPGESA